MGLPEYSYYFVLKWFLPIFKELGEVRVISDPSVEADALFAEATMQGRLCVLFSFSAPHKTTLPEKCPTIPVIAWEFEHIPDHQWDQNPGCDWRHILSKTGAAITHSEFARTAIKRAMTQEYPVWSIPAPVWDTFSAKSAIRDEATPHKPGKGINIHLHGALFDSLNHISTNPKAEWILPPPPEPKPYVDPKTEKLLKRKARRKRSLEKLLARLSGRSIEPPPEAPAPQPPSVPREHSVQAKGIVFASVLNSRDGRKNWVDLITSFASAFQNTEDAILVFKLNDPDSHISFMELEHELKRFLWLKCRIIAFNGYLPDDNYQHFLESVDFIVNASTGEGQCLPLMEMMSMGIPAIAPDHTSMADYINEQNAFILPSTRFLTGWPHDPRFVYSTMAYKVPWDALRDTFKHAYECAKNAPETYAAMSLAAHKNLKHHCSVEQAKSGLIAVLDHLKTQHSSPE